MPNCLLLAVNARATQKNFAIYCLKASASVLPEWQVSTLEISNGGVFAESLAQLASANVSLLGVSCYIWNIDTVLRLCRALRLIRPELKIVLGGHEVSHDPKYYVSQGVCDFVISGEGEDAFCKLLQVLQVNGDLSSVPGLSYWQAGGVVTNAKAPDIQPLDRLPSPYQTGFEATDRDFCYYESSRGCVYKCHFCLSALDRGARYYSLDRVFSDLKYILSISEINQVRFVDRTFNLNYQRSNAIWQWLLQHGAGKSFHFEIAAELFHDSSLKLLRQVPAGMFQFEIGLQSIHQSVLDQNGRRCRFDRLDESLSELLSQTAVDIHLDLIAGLGGETFAMFTESFNWAIRKGPHVLQIETLKILKGSISRAKSGEHGYIFMPDPPYTLLQSNLFSYEQLRLVEEISALLDLFYNREALRAVTVRAMELFSSPWEFFTRLRNFFVTKHQTFTALHLRKAYTIMAEFLQHSFDEPDVNLWGVLTLDAIKHLRCGKNFPFPRRSQPQKPDASITHGYLEVFPTPVAYGEDVARAWLVQNQGETIQALD